MYCNQNVGYYSKEKLLDIIICIAATGWNEISIFECHFTQKDGCMLFTDLIVMQMDILEIVGCMSFYILYIPAKCPYYICLEYSTNLSKEIVFAESKRRN